MLYKELEDKGVKGNIEVNQVIYVIPDGNRARRIRDTYKEVEKWVVTKVGRRYFYAKKEGGYEIQFEIYCGYIKDKSEFSANYKVFLTESDYLFEYTCYKMNKRDIARYRECMLNI